MFTSMFSIAFENECLHLSVMFLMINNCDYCRQSYSFWERMAIVTFPTEDKIQMLLDDRGIFVQW